MTRVLSRLKQAIVPPGRDTYTIKAGPFMGLRMSLDLRSQSQIYLGLFERELYPWLRRYTADIVTAIDIGAGHGEYSLYFLAKTGACRVLSFEPDRASRGHLVHNLDLNGFAVDPRLCVCGGFVGASGYSLDIFSSLITPPCLVKIDVDGGEYDILTSAPRLLRFSGITWLIETHSPQLEADCITILCEAGYTPRVIANAWWRTIVPEQRPSPHNRWLVAPRRNSAGAL
jgi:hypothetical protein